MVLQHGVHRGLDGQVAEVAAPGDARRRADRGRSPSTKASGGSSSDSGARGSGPAMARSSRAASCDAARQRPEDAHRVPRVGRRHRRHAARRGAQPDDVAEGGGVADARAEIRPVGERDHAARHRGRRAAAAAARRARAVVGVARRAEDGVEGLRAGAELGRVGLADDDRAGAAQAGDDQRVCRRDVVAVDRRAVGRPHARGVLEVLDGDRQAVQRPGRLVARERGVGRRGPAQAQLGVEGDDRVEQRVDRLDAGQVRLHDLHAAHLAPADRGRQLGRAPAPQLVAHGRHPCASRARSARGGGIDGRIVRRSRRPFEAAAGQPAATVRPV